MHFTVVVVQEPEQDQTRKRYVKTLTPEKSGMGRVRTCSNLNYLLITSASYRCLLFSLLEATVDRIGRTRREPICTDSIHPANNLLREGERETLPFLKAGTEAEGRGVISHVLTLVLVDVKRALVGPDV